DAVAGQREQLGDQLHVDAKRYLCATRPGYFAALSEDSKRSLALQGGIFSDGGAGGGGGQGGGSGWEPPADLDDEIPF
ncbi:MAG: hypothetical protein H7Z12_07255, partial [Rhodospirillaceae bacterium]|nr:hypothetical protein [Rhodospirillales bacterium]